jgi:hypothetical protein
MIGGDDISASGQPTGWAGVANAIANKKQYSVEVPTEGLVGKAAPARGKALTANDLDEGAPFQIPGFMPLGADRRFLYPLLNRTVGHYRAIGVGLPAGRESGDRWQR